MIQLYESQLIQSMGRIMGRLSEIEVPSVLLRPVIHTYSAVFGINLEEIAEPNGGFGKFGDFFVRRLKAEARPICQDQGSFISPSDGDILVAGDIDHTAPARFSIKGETYCVEDLMADSHSSEKFEGGGYMVIYLHPRDYHRVHIPTDASLARIRHIPGTKYPVADWATSRVDGIYRRNERVIFEFELPGGGFLSLVMVAAFGVGNIESNFEMKMSANHSQMGESNFEPVKNVRKGGELGAFRLGSTVVMMWSKDTIQLDSDFIIGPVSMGKRIGLVRNCE